MLLGNTRVYTTQTRKLYTGGKGVDRRRKKLNFVEKSASCLLYYKHACVHVNVFVCIQKNRYVTYTTL